LLIFIYLFSTLNVVYQIGSTFYNYLFNTKYGTKDQD